MSNEGLTLVRDRWYTALTADVTSAATSLPVVTNVVGGNTLPTPCIIMCGFEQMYATASTATTITVTRGFNSTAAAHARGATVGIARVAAHHNDVVAAIVGLGGGPSVGSQVVGSTSSPTTASGTPADLAQMTITPTLAGGRLLLVLFETEWKNDTATAATVFTLLVGGSSVASRQPTVRTNNEENMMVIHWLQTSPAGSTNIKVQWSVTGGTATAIGARRSLSYTEF